MEFTPHSIESIVYHRGDGLLPARESPFAAPIGLMREAPSGVFFAPIASAVFAQNDVL